MTTEKRSSKKTDPITELVSKDEDQLAEMFGNLSDKLTNDTRDLIKALREFRDAGFAARADATGTERFLDRAVHALEILIAETDTFVAALDGNKPLPIPALRVANTEAHGALDQLKKDFDEFLAMRPSLRARKDRDAALLTGVGRALETAEA